MAELEVAMSGTRTIPEVIGLPPSSLVDEPLILNSMPQMIIQPCDPKFQVGKTLFSLQPNWKKYKDLLEYHGYAYPYANSLKVAFLADSFPTDSFTNTYSESFLNRFTDILSSGVFEMQQMLGTRDLSSVPGDMLSALEEMGGPFENIASGAKKVGKSATDKIKDAYNTFVRSSGPVGRGVKSAVQAVKNITQGRLDFPMIWKNSGFTPSYTVTVRLYNPNPANIEHRRRYITGPLAALLLLGLPYTKDGSTYQWPFFHKIEVPGLLRLHSAYIGNITVVKGGDQQQIAYNQTMGMVDVRIEFGSLYDSMVAGLDYDSSERPTLKNYLETIEGGGKSLYKTKDSAPLFVDSANKTLNTSTGQNTTKKANDVSSEPSSRVSDGDKVNSETLESSSPMEGVKQDIKYPRPIGCDLYNKALTANNLTPDEFANKYSNSIPDLEGTFNIYQLPCNSVYSDAEIKDMLERGETVTRSRRGVVV